MNHPGYMFSAKPAVSRRSGPRKGLAPHRQPAVRAGDFEHAVLAAVRRLNGSAFGAAICRDLSSRMGRDVALAQVYVALARLEEKGLLSHHYTDPEPVRGGRSRKTYHLEASGVQALDRAEATLKALYVSSANKGSTDNEYPGKERLA